jgi:Rho GDP-dissociation inhibitor
MQLLISCRAFSVVYLKSKQGNLENFKDSVVKLKEGCSYRVKLEFYVQRDIISGLKFVQSAYKGPIRGTCSIILIESMLYYNCFDDLNLLLLKADKSSYMLGSRPPKAEVQGYISEKEVAPSGMIGRGKYHMKTHITDDDKNTYAKWEWTLEIVKEWEPKA